MHKTRLTPCELRTAFLIVQGNSIKQTAKILGKAPETIKCQLQAVYHKTGLGRQSLLLLFLFGQHNMEAIIENVKRAGVDCNVQFELAFVAKFTFKYELFGGLKLASWEPCTGSECVEIRG